MKIWQIAIGVTTGILAATMIQNAIEEARIHSAIEQMNKVMESQKAESARSTMLLRQNQIEAAEQKRREAEREREELANTQRVQAGMAITNAAAKDKREEAWKHYYQPTNECKKEWTGTCADAFIIAKRTFETTYNPNK